MSNAKRLIDLLRCRAKALGITSTMSKERDLCALVFYGRPYASVIPAEKGGVLPSPRITDCGIAAVLGQYPNNGDYLLNAARELIDSRDSPRGDTTQSTCAPSKSRQVQEHALPDHHFDDLSLRSTSMSTKSSSVEIDADSCRSASIDAEQLASRIEELGESVGHSIDVDIVRHGGTRFPHAVVSIRSGGADREASAKAINEVGSICRAAFADLHERIARESPDLLAIFDRPAVESWRAVNRSIYRVKLKGISTEVTVSLRPDLERGGFSYRQSHYMKTPMQPQMYVPGVPWGDNLGYALTKFIGALQSDYNIAISAGHTPSTTWLVPNRS